MVKQKVAENKTENKSNRDGGKMDKETNKLMKQKHKPK